MTSCFVTLLDLVDARDVERDALPRLLPDRLRRFLRDDADLGQRVAGVGLDLEPDAEARLGRPDRGHLGAGIAGDHAASHSLGSTSRRAVYRNAAREFEPLAPADACIASRAGASRRGLSACFADNRRHRARRGNRRRLGRAASAGARPGGRACRSPGRGGGRDELRQRRHRAERGGLPLRSSRARRARSRAPRSTSIRACTSATPRCRAIAPCGVALFPRLDSPARRDCETAMAMRGLVGRCVAEHRALAEAAGARRAVARGRLDQGLPHARAAKTRARRGVEEPKPFGVAERHVEPRADCSRSSRMSARPRSAASITPIR